MMDVGWKLDTSYLESLTKKLEIQQDKILYRIEGLVGKYVNPNSSQQVGEVLFGDFGLHPVRMTDSGIESTDNKVLADLRIYCNSKLDSSASRVYRDGYDFCTYVLDWRERNKLKTTYTTVLPKKVDSKSRLHTLVKQASVQSGRLASADPNLQNIPARSSNGKKIRSAFICEEGNVLVAVDYGQIEMRVLAHESNEKKLIKAISKGLDVHNLTTSKIFGIPIDKVTKDMWQRDASKTLGFGIVYGISAAALKTQIKLQSARHSPGGIDVSIDQCEEWIDDYTHTTYPDIGGFMADSQAEARRYGYVEDMFGRRRYLPGVQSKVSSIAAESERIATNHKIQAGAQGVIKLAMAEIWDSVLPRFRSRGYCECLMQIHDELVFEVKKELAEELKAAVEKVMRGVIQLRVPIVADGNIALRWSELK
jgi:DNA polymerase I